jgi:hypothetical protein
LTEPSEPDLKEALIRHLAGFLLELGDNFAFLAVSGGFGLTTTGFASISLSSTAVCGAFSLPTENWQVHLR